ncbi:MAG: hypothetical protein ACI8XM_000225 [Haloarculaceae archaeon]|jgi:hypothetical protein
MSAIQSANGFDLDTTEPITHDYDRVGHTVLAECCVCCTSGGRRLLNRDYDLQDDFRQPLGPSEHYLPAAIYRDCEECGKETTHFVC